MPESNQCSHQDTDHGHVQYVTGIHLLESKFHRNVQLDSLNSESKARLKIAERHWPTAAGNEGNRDFL